MKTVPFFKNDEIRLNCSVAIDLIFLMVSAFLNKVQHFKDKKVITVPFNFIFLTRKYKRLEEKRRTSDDLRSLETCTEKMWGKNVRQPGKQIQKIQKLFRKKACEISDYLHRKHTRSPTKTNFKLLKCFSCNKRSCEIKMKYRKRFSKDK